MNFETSVLVYLTFLSLLNVWSVIELRRIRKAMERK